MYNVGGMTTPSLPYTTMTTTIGNCLQDLNTTPHLYECYRRIYLWKHFLYATLGPRKVNDVNRMLEEIRTVSCNLDLPSALEMVTRPTYKTHVVLHDYPEVTYKSVQYLLHGVGEEIIDPQAMYNASIAALAELRIDLNNGYYTTPTTTDSKARV
ncbi:hypothetical protein [Microcoleus phage My-WqHQDG]|nr:hypothetical protein [Microcoleus phage My-WqHQDG]